MIYFARVYFAWLRWLALLLILLLALGGCSRSAEALEPLARQLITASDFEYLGAFAPPQHALDNPEGGQWSTAYATGGLAMRRVGEQKRFFATTHSYSGGLVYEMKFPGLSKTAPYPQARIVHLWGDIYQGRKTTQEGSQLNGDVLTHGLYWDAALRRLYWSYGHTYNVAQVNNPVLGYSRLGNTSLIARGPWQSAPGSAHSQRIRGGVLRIPNWFAQRYTNGKTLGIGFGGYWSGVANASQGPALYAIATPNQTHQQLEPQALLAFSDGSCNPITPQNVRRCKAVRNSGYARSVSDPISWDTNPIHGKGYWTGADSIEGAAVWIDTPNKHGLIFFPTLGQGEICYCNGGIGAQSYSSYWYIYHPGRLARVARGELEPWQVNPHSMTRVSYPAGVRVTGAVFDDQEQILYLYVYQAYQDGVEWFPLVYAYQLKP